MCWDMNFPEDWLCSLTVMAPKVVGATCSTKFRPIAGLCAMRKVLGYVWLKCLQGNETARCELVFDGFDFGDLEWKLHEGALRNGDVEQSSGEPGTSSRDGVSGRKCKTCDRTQNSSSQQMSGDMETCVEFSMAPQIVAAEHCKDYDGAGLPLEFECLDDGQGTKRQNCELERENGGEFCWSEEAARDGTGSVVETLAQDWSSMDRERQHECAGCHQRTNAQLGRPCGQDGLQRNLREGLEMPRPSMGWPSPTTVQKFQMGGHGCW